VCVPYPFARTSGRRAVSAVSLFYYEADKQNHLARSRGRGVPKTHCYTLDFGSYGYWDMGLGLGSISCAREERICTATPRVLRTLSRSSILSLSRWLRPWETHTQCTLCIYRCGELNRFPIRFGNSSRQRATVAVFEFIANSALARCATVSVVGSCYLVLSKLKFSRLWLKRKMLDI